MPAAGVTAAALGNNQIVAAVTGKKISVRSFVLFNGVATANTVKWRSANTDITTPTTLATAAGPSHGLVGTKEPLFETKAGEALNLNLSAATAVGGWIDYTLESA